MLAQIHMDAQTQPKPFADNLATQPTLSPADASLAAPADCRLHEAVLPHPGVDAGGVLENKEFAFTLGFSNLAPKMCKPLDDTKVSMTKLDGKAKEFHDMIWGTC